MRNFALFAAVGFACTLAGFAVVLLPFMAWLDGRTLVQALQSLLGFTIMMGTAPVLINAFVLSVLLRKRLEA